MSHGTNKAIHPFKGHISGKLSNSIKNIYAKNSLKYFVSSVVPFLKPNFS